MNGHFSYYGVIIKQLKGYNSTITVKNLLNDQSNMDNKSIFFEKDIQELENESFSNIIIGNGFIGLLSIRGAVFTLEYSDKLTMLYSKFFVYNISVAHNEIYGLCKDNIPYSLQTMNTNLGNSVMPSNNPYGNKTVTFNTPFLKESNFRESHYRNYYMAKWVSKVQEKEVNSEFWTTTLYKISEEFENFQNISLLASNNNRSLLLLMEREEKMNNLNHSFFNPTNNEANNDNSNNDLSLDNSMNNITILENNNYNHTKKIFPENFFNLR
jgi:hypothetical protein